MTLTTHPAMKVESSIVKGKRQYNLTLSRENFNHLCDGCPEIDSLIGNDNQYGAMFRLFPNTYGKISKSFEFVNDMYILSVGAPYPTIPFGASGEKIDELAQQASDNLEKAINESGRIPMEMKSGNRAINLGYVVMKVEKNN